MVPHRGFVDSLKREFACSTQHESRKSQKHVRFQTPETEKSSALSPIMSIRDVPRFRKDFCDILKAHLGTPCSPSSCIGLLENEGSSKHRVYAPSKEVIHCNRRQTTLLKILTSSRSQKDATGGLATYQKLHLAKNLAVAFLQYHATPWMSISWRTRDLYLFEINDEKRNSQSVNVSSLHVNVKVKDVQGDTGKPQMQPF